jgi:hypothetical protein
VSARVVFVGVDPNYAIGVEKWVERYAVACRHETPVLALLEARGIEVFCLERALGRSALPGRSTVAVASHPALAGWLGGEPVDLLVFKPNAQIEAVAAERGWGILGARASIARPIENKVHFFRLLDELGLPRPAWREVDLAREGYDEVARELGPRMVLQAAHGFSGNRTFVIDGATDFARAAEALRRRKARASRRFDGSPMTMNACVRHDGGVRTGALFHQVTGVPECTVYPMGACGNDWAACPPPRKVVEATREVARAVGRALAGRGFRGIFGLDFVAAASEIVTIECNPRLVSSVPMASALEAERGARPLLVSHLSATRGLEDDGGDVVEEIEAAQLVLHNLEGGVGRVGAALAAGVYVIEHDALRFRRSALSPTECLDEEEFLLLPPAPGHFIRPAGECARVQSRGPLLELEGFGSGPGRLSPRARRLARTVYAALRLERVEGVEIDGEE